MKNVEELLTKHKPQLEALANALVEKETLYYEDIVRLFEPHRSSEDIRRELAELADRKMIGKRPLLNMDWIIQQAQSGDLAGTVLGGEMTTNNFAIDEDRR
jgi:hypothetical protein